MKRFLLLTLLILTTKTMHAADCAKLPNPKRYRQTLPIPIPKGTLIKLQTKEGNITTVTKEFIEKSSLLTYFCEHLKRPHQMTVPFPDWTHRQLTRFIKLAQMDKVDQYKQLEYASPKELTHYWELERYLDLPASKLQAAIIAAAFNKKITSEDDTLLLEHPTLGAPYRKVLETPLPIDTFHHEAPVYAIDYKNGKLASGSGDRTAKIWDPKTLACLHTLHHSRAVSAVKLNPKATSLATTSLDGLVRLWNTESGKLIQQFNLPNSIQSALPSVEVVDFSPSGQKLLGASFPIIRIWDTLTGLRIRELKYDGPLCLPSFLNETTVDTNSMTSSQKWDLIADTVGPEKPIKKDSGDSFEISRWAADVDTWINISIYLNRSKQGEASPCVAHLERVNGWIEIGWLIGDSTLYYCPLFEGKNAVHALRFTRTPEEVEAILDKQKDL